MKTKLKYFISIILIILIVMNYNISMVIAVANEINNENKNIANSEKGHQNIVENENNTNNENNSSNEKNTYDETNSSDDNNKTNNENTEKNELNNENTINNNKTEEIKEEKILDESKQKKLKSAVKTQRSIADGIYKIETILNYGPAFDIEDGSFEDNAKIQLWDYVNAEQQKFKITLCEDGYYEIKSIYTEKVLAVSNNNVSNGTNIIQKSKKGTDDERWSINDEGNGKYSISSKINNYYIDIPDYNAINGKKIQMHFCNNTSAQRFKISNVKTSVITDGRYNINAVYDGNQSLDITDGSKKNGVQIQTWDYVGAFQQTFQIEKIDDEYYKIQSAYSGKALTVENNASEKNVIQQDFVNADSQKWKIKLKSNGKYLIVSKVENYALEFQGKGNGTKLKVNKITGNENQLFSFKSKRILKNGKTLDEGFYKIESVMKYKPAFDITDGSKEDGTKIQLWDYVNAEQQKFEFIYDKEGYYTIQSLYTNKVLAIENTKASNGTSIIQKTEQGTDDEKWIIKDEGNGTYSINSKINYSSIEVPSGNAVNGQKLQIYDWQNNQNQKFTITKVRYTKKIEDGVYRITASTNESMSFDIDYGKRENGTNVQLWDWAGEKSYQQQFKFIYDSKSEAYTIYNINTGKVLDVQNAGKTSGTNIWQYESNGTYAQKWILEQNGDGTYSIKSKLNGLYIDIQNNNISNGGNVQLYEGNGTDAQKFKFIKQTDKAIRFIDDGMYRIATKYNNNIGFDITDGSKENGAKIQLWDYVNATQEEFSIYYEDGYYYIESLYSKKVIQAKGANEILEQQTKKANEDAQKWIFEPNNGSYSIISKKTGLYIDITDAKYINGNKIQTHYGNGNIAQQFVIKTIEINIDNNKYPGIKERITQLKKAHPDWQFEILYTGIDFNEAVKAEYEGSNKQKSLIDINTYKCDWISEDPYVSGSWASASYNAVQYFMDVRNFLNDTNILQFVDLGNYWESGATYDSIQYQVNNTFLQNYTNDVIEACESTNINPYYILARLFQEQSKQGSDTINMAGGDGKRYFNPFNIGAQVGNDVQTALERAKREGWDSMKKGLEGGINIIKERYINKKQNTLYLNKFDVNPASGGNLYENQYMQNISASYSEANTMKKPYEQTGTFNNKKNFIIPVYENMPTTPYAKPTGTGKNPLAEIKGPKSVKVVTNGANLKLRDTSSTKGNILEELPSGTILLSVERLSNRWQKVVTPSGKKGYCSGEYLQTIEDQTNCYDTMYINSDGVNIRIGPGTEYDSITKKSTGTKVTRIVTNKYFYNNLWWDEIILPDGTKGFIANKYLSY